MSVTHGFAAFSSDRSSWTNLRPASFNYRPSNGLPVRNVFRISSSSINSFFITFSRPSMRTYLCNISTYWKRRESTWKFIRSLIIKLLAAFSPNSNSAQKLSPKLSILGCPNLSQMKCLKTSMLFLDSYSETFSTPFIVEYRALLIFSNS